MEIQNKWFAETIPTNATKAKATIGSGDNGTVTITCDSVGTEGNNYEVAIVISEEANAAMSAEIVSNVITITLGTGSSAGVVDSAKNTATLIATAISALESFTAVKSGTGASLISTATTENVAFENGSYGTVCPIGDVWLHISNVYYYCTAPNDKYSANWRTVTFTEY